MKTIIKLVIMLITIAQLFTACRSHTFEENGKLTIAVSIIPQETFVKEIAGDFVNIVTLIPPGKSPANYAPSPQGPIQKKRTRERHESLVLFFVF